MFQRRMIRAASTSLVASTLLVGCGQDSYSGSVTTNPEKSTSTTALDPAATWLDGSVEGAGGTILLRHVDGRVCVYPASDDPVACFDYRAKPFLARMTSVVDGIEYEGAAPMRLETVVVDAHDSPVESIHDGSLFAFTVPWDVELERVHFTSIDGTALSCVPSTDDPEMTCEPG